MTPEVATVYRAENGRRYFTKKAAARATIRARFRKKWPCEGHDEGYPDGFASASYCDGRCRFDGLYESERYERFISRAVRLILRGGK